MTTNTDLHGAMPDLPVVAYMGAYGDTASPNSVEKFQAMASTYTEPLVKLSDARAAIQQAAVPEGWISVLDRLPDGWSEVDDSPCILQGKPVGTMYTGVPVLVSLSGGGVQIDHLVQIGESGKPWWSKYGERVTHWQSKPAPAKRGGK